MSYNYPFMKQLSKIVSLTLLSALLVSGAYAQFSLSVGVSINTAPPALPVYTQPPCPVDGYMWTPGYWAYGDDGYYWVPGVWVPCPTPGYLWTPGYWGFAGGIYGWHGGYWGPHIGFYGGCNYGGGYGGVGFIGGGWQGGVYRYNTAVVNVNTTVVRNVYVDKTVINNTTVINNHASFNGPGGITRQPNAQERIAANDHHVAPTQAQFDHSHTASQDHNAYARNNGGRPQTTAMNKVGGERFNPHGAPGAPVNRTASTVNHAATRPATVNHSANTVNHPNNSRPATTPSHPASSHPMNNPSHPANSHPMNTPSHPATTSHPSGNPGGSHPSSQHSAPASHPEGHPGGGEPHHEGHR